MSDLNQEPRKGKSGQKLMGIGLFMIFFPIVCLFIMLASTGHAIQEGIEAAIYWVFLVGMYAGAVTVPVGISLLMVGAKMIVRDRRS